MTQNKSNGYAKGIDDFEKDIDLDIGLLAYMQSRIRPLQFAPSCEL